MGRTPQRHPDGTDGILYLRVPGWLKNELVDQADAAGLSLAAYVGAILHRIARQDAGLPEPPPARAPIPTITDVLHEYATGEPLLTPCGKQRTCDGLDATPRTIGSIQFCAVCDIRLS